MDLALPALRLTAVSNREQKLLGQRRSNFLLLRLLPANAFFTTPRVTSFTEIRGRVIPFATHQTMLDFCLLVPTQALHTQSLTLKSSKRVANFCGAKIAPYRHECETPLPRSRAIRWTLKDREPEPTGTDIEAMTLLLLSVHS